jgi:hypothetical protein
MSREEHQYVEICPHPSIYYEDSGRGDYHGEICLLAGRTLMGEVELRVAPVNLEVPDDHSLWYYFKEFYLTPEAKKPFEDIMIQRVMEFAKRKEIALFHLLKPRKIRLPRAGNLVQGVSQQTFISAMTNREKLHLSSELLTRHGFQPLPGDANAVFYHPNLQEEGR